MCKVFNKINMSHTLKQIISAVLMIVLILSSGLMPAYAAGKAKRSSFKYKKYAEHEKYRKALFWRMNGVYNTISDYMDDDNTLPIPGLVKTYSLFKGKGQLSKQFVPQGICRAGRFWLITAYDAEEKCSSVIYAVDTLYRELAATIALPNRYHAGGIAYDGYNIWLTGDTSDKYEGDPFLQYIRFDDFVRMLDEPLHKVTDDEISRPIYIKNKPSFLEYDSDILWVGTYIGKSSTSESYMYGYKILNKESDPKLNTILLSVISGLDSSAQGADIEEDYLYVSSSYKGYSLGVRSSFVTKYNIRPIKQGYQNISLTGREVSRIEVPKMNEEILVEDGKVYINFESASELWKNAVIMTDRILYIDQSLWE